AILFKNLEGKYLTLEECIKANGGVVVEEKEKAEKDGEEENKEEDIKTTIYYVTDEQQQSQYINMFKKQGQDAVLLTNNIDTPFINMLEQKNPTVSFKRIDTGLSQDAKEEISEEQKEAFKKDSDSLIATFRKVLDNEKLDVVVEKLKDENVASMMTLSEENRRMQEMMKQYGMDGMDMGGQETLILNANHPLVKFILEHKKSKSVPIISKQLYDLAMLSHKRLSPEEMTEFVKRSNEIMLLLTK
ncbi:MAG TPA: molecular chaperone HtpG, partial [Candidatus Dorea intestinavium]|nr:molecular chaperone HtpG [Candidatus Dorea intestinavium]